MIDADLVRLLEENITMLDRMGPALRANPARVSGMPRPQVSALVRLYTGGAARLKDIADREHTTTPNLCALFRVLEKQGLIYRTQDQTDRRNVWYDITPAGVKVARRAIEEFRSGLARVFGALDHDDTMRMTAALKTMNEIMKKMENKNEKN